jgi:hypothetical protein
MFANSSFVNAGSKTSSYVKFVEMIDNCINILKKIVTDHVIRCFM